MWFKKKYLNDVQKIARFFFRPDWVQGGGGNFSIKIDDKLMLIKASGFSFADVSPKSGLVLVNYFGVKEYFSSISGRKISAKQENLSSKKVDDLTINFLKGSILKASIETGFHAFLAKYVIHTHSVYANLINCSLQGNSLIKDIFKDKIDCVFVPYENPGFNLTKGIKKQLDKYYQKNKILPKVFFLQNHGIIINSNSLKECFSLYLKVDLAIKKFFHILDYPKIKVIKQQDFFVSKTVFLKKYLSNKSISQKLFLPILFPDQIVYLNGLLIKKNNKFWLNNKVVIFKNEICYLTSKKESQTIEETLVAYFYLRQVIENLKLGFSCLPQTAINFVKKMDSEKYRKKFLSK